MRDFLSIALLLFLSTKYAGSTSIKMDFLPLADVRTDPIISPTCLADHVHTFYGTQLYVTRLPMSLTQYIILLIFQCILPGAKRVRPETTYTQMRNADGNSGNVVENKSLYWHPTVYSYDPDTGIYTKDDIYFSSAYYIWTTGEARAFPDGFKVRFTKFNVIS